MNRSIEISHCSGVTPSSYSSTGINYATAVGTSILVILSAAFSSVANALVIIVFVRKRLLNLPINTLLAHMCLTNFIVGTIEQPIFAALRITELHFMELCILKQVSAFLGYLCGGMTICTLCLISLDRWVAITIPFRYESMVTTKLCLILIALSYMLCTGMVLLHKFGVLATNLYYMMVSFFLILLTTQALICYAKIYKIARSHERRVDLTRRVTQKSTISTKNEIETFTLESAREGAMKNKAVNTMSQRRKSITVVYMALFVVICYLPKAMIMLDAFLFRKKDSLSYAALKWSETLFLMNSTFNPLIYCLRMAYIRTEIWKMLETLMTKLSRK